MQRKVTLDPKDTTLQFLINLPLIYILHFPQNNLIEKSSYITL